LGEELRLATKKKNGARFKKKKIAVESGNFRTKKQKKMSETYDDDPLETGEDADDASAVAAAVAAVPEPKNKPVSSGNNANVFGLAYHPLNVAAFGHVVPCNFGKDANFNNSDYFM